MQGGLSKKECVERKGKLLVRVLERLQSGYYQRSEVTETVAERLLIELAVEEVGAEVQEI